MTFDGAPTGQERNLLKASWDAKGEKIVAGSGDQSVAIWESRTGKLLNKLPGHRGAVNDVRFHPLGEPLCKSQIFSLPRVVSFCQTSFAVSCDVVSPETRKTERSLLPTPALSSSFAKGLGKPRLRRVHLRRWRRWAGDLSLHPRFNAFDRRDTKHEADLATVVVSASSDRTLMVGELGR